MDQPKFVIEATGAESMAQSLGLPSVHHLLPTLVQQAQPLARPPISNFHVSAAGLGSDGRVFLGVNLEFPGLPLHHTVHAEQFLITNAAVHRCPRLLAVAVSAFPCGHCRQFLQELRHSSSLKLFITNPQTHSHQNLEINFKPLIDFLPNSFGPFDLLGEEKPLLLDPHNNGLSLSPTHLKNSPLLSNGVCELFNKNTPKRSDFYSKNENLNNDLCKKVEKNETLLRKEALEAANESHAPYSGCPSGVALMDCDGKVYRGSYAESAAYNPSLGPVQAALVAYVAGGGGGYDRIMAAVLVEKEGAMVMQEDSARLILKVVAPKCDFRVFHCCLGDD